MTTSQKQVFYENGRIVAKEHPLASQNAKTFIMSDTGIQLDYDLLGTPKQFSISGGGINFQDGTNNYTTGLERLALVQTAFQAVELPPNATTLKINDTILVDAGVATQSTTIEDGKITINNASVGGIANPLLVLQNNNTTAGGSTIETYKNDLPTSTGGDVVGIWTASCNTNVGKTEISRISQIAYGVGASNNDGGIILACKVNSSLAPTNFLACNGGAGAGEVQIFRPITNPTGDIALNATSSSGTGDILLTPKTTGYVRANGDILTDSKITTLTGFPINTGSSIDFIASPDYRFTIDPTKLELHYNNLINTQSTQQIFQDILTDEAYFKQIYIDYIASKTAETIIQNDKTHHRIRLEDITNNKSFTIDNDFTTNSNRLSTFTSDNVNLEGTTTLTTLYNDQVLNFTSSNSTTSTSKSLILNNAVGGGVLTYINNSGDTTGLTIDSANNNLLLKSSSVFSGQGNIEFAPSQFGTADGQIVFTGASLQSNTAGGNSGEYLVITLNGTQYKIKLENP
jgi:hypothetical protein